jgi:CheY-like chemotaxis protein
MQPSRVLCLDDDEVLLQLLQAVLQEAGYIVLPASNGRQALRLAAEREFEAAVLDYGLPDLTGGQVASQLRRTRPDVPILMFSGTGNISPEDTVHVNVIVPKGEGVKALVAVLGRVIHQQKGVLAAVRQRPRYSVKLPFAVRTERSAAAETLPGFATSIGEGGIGGAVSGSLCPGEFVQIVVLDSQSGVLLEPRAQVRYRTQDCYGFAFVDVSAPERDHLRQYCRQLAALR